MTVNLNRDKIFFIGVAIIILYLFLNRLDFIINSRFTNGQVVDTRYWSSGGRSGGSFSAPIIQFELDSFIYKFQGETNTNLENGLQVRVVYKKSDPSNARVYNFFGFWFVPALESALIVMLLGAVVYSFLSEFAIYKVTFGKQIKFEREWTATDSDQKQIEG